MRIRIMRGKYGVVKVDHFLFAKFGIVHESLPFQETLNFLVGTVPYFYISHFLDLLFLNLLQVHLNWPVFPNILLARTEIY